MSGPGYKVDRRTTIRWLAATMVAANTGCSSIGDFVGEEIPPATGVIDTLLGRATEPGTAGYGTDPDLMSPAVPWPRTMSAAQLAQAAALSDTILPSDNTSPAASAVGVHEFIDEWVSAPYPQQRSDRPLILDGLEWLEQQSRTLYGASFSQAGEHQKTALLDRIAWPDRADSADIRQVEFFARFRYLATGAYYTTEPGMNDIGYIGNTPIVGDYPGPTEAALRHLASVLEQLGLDQS